MLFMGFIEILISKQLTVFPGSISIIVFHTYYTDYTESKKRKQHFAFEIIAENLIISLLILERVFFTAAIEKLWLLCYHTSSIF